MRAAVFYRSGEPMVVEERPDPEPGPDQIVLRVERCGICGSELHINDGPPRDFPGGFVMGHEFSGTIAALGANVTGLSLGQRVAAYPCVGCGNCAACAQGNEVLCLTAERTMGGFAEYALLPARSAMPLPDRLSPADGALIEPLTVSLYGVRQAAIGPGDRVLILGAGTIALAAIYWAKCMGAGRIAAMSRSDRRAEMAMRMGADAFVCYGDNEKREVAEALGGEPDHVFECVGAPGMLGKAIGHVRQFGQVLSLGFAMAPDPIVPAEASFKAVTLRFPVGYSFGDFRYAAQEMLNGHIDPKAMISSTVALADLPDKFEELLGPNNETKVQVAP